MRWKQSVTGLSAVLHRHIILEERVDSEEAERDRAVRRASSPHQRKSREKDDAAAAERDRSVQRGASVRLIDSLTNRRDRPQILTSDIDGAERLLAMLQHMVTLGVANEESYAIAMQAFLRRGRNRWKSPQNEKQIICAADLLEILLEQLEQNNNSSGGGPIIISISTYNLVLEAFANCATPRGERDYAAKAGLLFQRLDSDNQANVESILHVLHAWAWQQANLQPGTCAERANQLLDILIQRTEDLGVLLQCHNWVLEAWSKSGSEGSAEKANELFCKMIELNETIATNPVVGNSDSTLVLPNAQSYTNVILAWSKSHDLSIYGKKDDASAAQRAHDLLFEMMEMFKAGAFTDGSEPELIAFNGVITAWARLGRPDKGEQVLWAMDELRPLCRSLVPDVKTYNSVLHAHVKSSNKTKALQKAISLVQRMEENCYEQPAIKPDSFTYNTLMKAWIQSGHADFAQEVEKILVKMQALWETGDESVRPTTRNFNVVLNAYAKSNGRSAAKKAHDLLHQMLKMSSRCPPDIISYTTVMECYSKSANPNASVIAQELLQQAFDAYERRRPNRSTNNTATLMISNDENTVGRQRVTTWKDPDPFKEMPNCVPLPW